MTWKAKVLSTTDKRTAKVVSIGPPNKRKFVEVEFDNMDVGQVSAKDWGFKEGDEVTYSLETKEWSQGQDSFTVVGIIDFANEKMKEPEPVDAPISVLKALKDFHLKKVLFLDIECVRANKTLNARSPEFASWKYKRRKYDETDTKVLQESYKTDAALFAEFGKVVCVSIGRIDKDDKITLKSYYGHNEKELLSQVSEVLDFFSSKGFALGGFGIKGYDVPFMMRRMLINGVRVPDCLDVAGAKPWEVRIIDSSELWKSTGFYSASLINVAVAMGLPSPKTSMEGSEVSEAYYKSEENLIDIVRYCEDDVIATINITMPMFGKPFITEVESKTFENGAEEG